MKKRIPQYLLGLLVMAIGIAFSFKSNLGSSPISSIPYSVYLIWGIDVGLATVVFHIVLVLIQFILLRKDFKAKFLLQILAGVIFGYFTNLGVYLVSFIPQLPGIVGNVLFLIISMFVLAFGIFLYLPPNIIRLAGEGVMQAVAIVTNQSFSRIKVAFDSSMVITSAFLCWIFLSNPLASVGVGTILAAVSIGTILDFIVKLYTSRIRVKDCSFKLVG